MRQETTWIANDGTRFEGDNAYEECQKHEQNLRQTKLNEVQDYIQFFDDNGNPISPSAMAKNRYATYAHLSKIPDDDNEALNDAWGEVVPYELSDELYEGEDFWVQVSECRWRSWREITRDYNDFAQTIQKILEGK